LPIANEVASYLFNKYNLDIVDEFTDNPQGLVVYGLFFLYMEKTQPTNFSQSIEDNSIVIQGASLDCLITAVGSVIGITEVKSIWSGLMAGATEATAAAAAKLIFKRVAICVTSVFAIYELGDCLGIW
jgi:hypothetical protein